MAALSDEEKKQLARELNGAVKDGAALLRDLRAAIAEAKELLDAIHPMVKTLLSVAVQRAIDDASAEMDEGLEGIIASAAQTLKTRFDWLVLDAVSKRAGRWDQLAEYVESQTQRGMPAELVSFGWRPHLEPEGKEQNT